MHNPLRSEADMFRVVVLVGIAAAPIILAGLLISPLAGAILLCLEVGVGIGVFWQSARGSTTSEAEVASSTDSTHRILVVANETVGGRALLDELRRRTEGHPRAEVRIVAPPLAGTRAEHLSSDVDQAIADARERLEASLAAMSAAGITASGEVGDHHDPNAAITDALRTFAADEVVVSTHPPGRSRWLERDVLERARAEVPLPVTHVVVDLEAEAGEAQAAP